MKKIITLILILSTFLVIAQEKASLDKYIVDRVNDETGRELVKIIVPGKPPDDFRMPEAEPTDASASLTYVPAFDWSFGCSPTSAAMLAGYYDRTGYANMYAGPTNGGVSPLDNSVWGTVLINGATLSQCPFSATRNGLDGRTIRGHVDDYWILYGDPGPDPFIVNGWTQHSYGECTGDYMKTNQSSFTNTDGSTAFWYYSDGSPYTGNYANNDGMYGLNLFCQSRGYMVNNFFNQYIYGYNGNTLGFTFAQYKAEIDAGRPVLIQIEGHTMLGMGYNETGNLVYLHDTWDYATHQMTWGGSYAGLTHFGVGVIQLGPVTVDPCASVIPFSGCGSLYPQTYYGGGSGVWYTATSNPCGFTTPGVEQLFSFVPPVTGTYSIQVTAASGKVDYLWKASSCSPTGWNCIDDISAAGQYGSMYWTAGVTYYILLDDENSTQGTHTFYINCPVVCTDCPSYNHSLTPTTSWQTHSSSITASGCKMYRVSVTSGKSYIFKTGCGNGAIATFDTYLQLFNSGCTSIAINNDGCESFRSQLGWTATYTGYAYLKVRGIGLTNGTYTLAYIDANVPATRTLQNITIASGQSACYDASQTVTLAGGGTSFIVQSGGDATVVAGQKVLMMPGTKANSGSYVLAYIATNGLYCMALQNATVEAETMEEENEQIIDMGEAGFFVYPNPTTGHFTIEFDLDIGLQDCFVQVFSMTGTRIVAEEFKSIQWCRFDLSSQPRGIYIIQVVRGDRVDTVKITRQ